MFSQLDSQHFFVSSLMKDSKVQECGLTNQELVDRPFIIKLNAFALDDYYQIIRIRRPPQYIAFFKIKNRQSTLLQTGGLSHRNKNLIT